MKLTAEEARKVLRYNRRTGIFTWRKRSDVSATWNTRYAGRAAGTLYGNGYWYIRVHRQLYLRSRLAWLYVHGSWPLEEMDHKNWLSADDRFSNLRECSPNQNKQNSKSVIRSKSGIKGIFWREHRQKWQAVIQANNKVHFLGHFATAQLADAAYRQAQRKWHGEFACTGVAA